MRKKELDMVLASRWAKDFEIPIAVGTSDYGMSQSNRGMVNLIFIRGQVALFCKGILPYRGFRLKDVKSYFNVTGGKDVVLAKLDFLLEELLPKKQQNESV